MWQLQERNPRLIFGLITSCFLFSWIHSIHNTMSSHEKVEVWDLNTAERCTTFPQGSLNDMMDNPSRGRGMLRMSALHLKLLNYAFYSVACIIASIMISCHKKGNRKTLLEFNMRSLTFLGF